MMIDNVKCEEGTYVKYTSALSLAVVFAFIDLINYFMMVPITININNALRSVASYSASARHESTPMFWTNKFEWRIAC